MLLTRGNEGQGAERRGTLFVVATPIGNLEDVTLRALDTLRNADVIAAEDTRHTRKLLSRYDIHTPLTSYHAHNVQEKGPRLLGMLEEGKDLALVTDAGTPGISDPGTLLVRDAVDKGFAVVSIPGPAALIAALVVSGLPTHPFAFLGFAPPKGLPRKRFFQEHAGLPMTLVLYESPQRLLRTLRDALEHWGDRHLAVARELTKKHEEIVRGKISHVLEHFAQGTRGELTLIVEGCPPHGREDVTDDEVWQKKLEDCLLKEGMTVRAATESIVHEFGLPRRSVYQKALELTRSR